MKASKHIKASEIILGRIYTSSKDGKRYSLTKVAAGHYQVSQIVMSESMRVKPKAQLKGYTLGEARHNFYEGFGGFYRYA